MGAYLSENIGTIMAGLMLVLIVAAIIHGMIRNKRKGIAACGHSCGQDCTCCRMGGNCKAGQTQAR